MKLNNFFKVVAIVEFVIIIFVCIIFSPDPEVRTEIFTEGSPENTYFLKINEIGSTFLSGSTKVELCVWGDLGDIKLRGTDIQFYIANGGSVTKDIFNFEWFDEGVKIIINGKNQEQQILRVYWNDLFIID